MSPVNSNWDECLKKITGKTKKNRRSYKQPKKKKLQLDLCWCRNRDGWEPGGAYLTLISRESFHLNLNFINRIILYLSCLPFSWLSAWSQCLMCLRWWYFTILQSFSAHVPTPETKCKSPGWPLRYPSNISVTFHLKWPGNQDHNKK